MELSNCIRPDRIQYVHDHDSDIEILSIHLKRKCNNRYIYRISRYFEWHRLALTRVVHYHAVGEGIDNDTFSIHDM